MKKAMPIILAVILLFSFVGCNSYKDSPVEISGAYITKGVYSYFLNEVMSAPKEYSVDPDDSEAVKYATLVKCKEYIALINFCEKNGIETEQYLKRRAAEETEKYWGMFSDYYGNLAITKQDILKIKTNDARKTELLEYYFGESGKKPVSDDELKEEFVNLYVGFKAIEGSLTKVNDMGETVELTKSEKSALRKKFSNMAEKINAGESIDTVNSSYNDSLGIIVTDDLPTVMVKKGDPMYDDSFFSDVLDITHGRAGVIESGNSIYVIERITIATNDNDEFVKYRQEVLSKMKMPAIEKKIASLGEKFEANVNRKLINQIYSTVKSSKH